VTGSSARRVRAGTAGDAAACADIATGLLDFFTPAAVEKIRADATAHRPWVVTEGGRVVAFALVERRGRRAAEILAAATGASRRGRGIGTALVEHVLDDLRRAGTLLVEVKTLAPAAGYAPYDATYRFWTARGFVHVDTIDPLPGWEPGNPAAVLVAALAATVGGPHRATQRVTPKQAPPE